MTKLFRFVAELDLDEDRLVKGLRKQLVHESGHFVSNRSLIVGLAEYYLLHTSTANVTIAPVEHVIRGDLLDG